MNIGHNGLFSELTWAEYVDSVKNLYRDFIDPFDNCEPIILDDEFIDGGTKELLKEPFYYVVPEINIESKTLNPDGFYSYQLKGNPRFFRIAPKGWAHEKLMAQISIVHGSPSRIGSGDYVGTLLSITDDKLSPDEIEKCVRKISDVLAHLKKDVDELITGIPDMIRDTATVYMANIEKRNRV